MSFLKTHFAYMHITAYSNACSSWFLRIPKRLVGFWLKLTGKFRWTVEWRQCIEMLANKFRGNCAFFERERRRRSCIADSRILFRSLAASARRALCAKAADMCPKWDISPSVPGNNWQRLCPRNVSSALLFLVVVVVAAFSHLFPRHYHTDYPLSPKSGSLDIVWFAPEPSSSPTTSHHLPDSHLSSSVHPCCTLLLFASILLYLTCSKMKFLEHSHFEALNSALNFDAGIYRIIGRWVQFKRILHVLPDFNLLLFMKVHLDLRLFSNSFSSKSTKR